MYYCVALLSKGYRGATVVGVVIMETLWQSPAFLYCSVVFYPCCKLFPKSVFERGPRPNISAFVATSNIVSSHPAFRGKNVCGEGVGLRKYE